MKQSKTRLEQALEKAGDLPTVRVLALEIARAAKDKQGTAERLAAVISRDPVLAARLLKMSNSALFRGRAEITSLASACMRMGFRAVRMWSLALAMFEAFGRPDLESFDCDCYRQRSLVRAAAAALLMAERDERLVDEAFLAGLLARIGELALAVRLPGEFDSVLAVSENRWPSVERQRELLGYATSELGAALLRGWEIHELICDAVERAEDAPVPAPVEGGQEPAAVDAHSLTQSVHLAVLFEQFLTGDRKAEALEAFRSSARRLEGARALHLEALLFSQLPSRLDQVAEIVGAVAGSDFDVDAAYYEAQRGALEKSVQGFCRSMSGGQSAGLDVEAIRLAQAAQPNRSTGLADAWFLTAVGRCWPGKDGWDALPQPIAALSIQVVGCPQDHSPHDPLPGLVGRAILDLLTEDEIALHDPEEGFLALLPQIGMPDLERIAEAMRVAIENRSRAVGKDVVARFGGATWAGDGPGPTIAVLREAAFNAARQALDKGAEKIVLREIRSQSPELSVSVSPGSAISQAAAEASGCSGSPENQALRIDDN